jgi:hypothetical protein
MPSLRGRPSHNFSRPKPPRRSNQRLKKSLKQRLIRKYLRSTHSKAHIKHGSASNLRAPASNPANLEISVLKSLKMALDRKSAKTDPVVAEVTAIPNPTPGMATTTTLTDTQGYGSPLLSPVASPTSVSPLSSVTRSRTARLLTTFSALPPLQSLVASSPANITAQASPTSSIPPVETLTPRTKDAGAHGDFQPHQVSLAIIVLLGVGAGLLLLGVCIIIKMCTRPTRRPRPIPSLPLPKDLDPDDQFYESKESPIFGGKERHSALHGTNGPMWTWVQYPQPASKHSQLSNQDINGSQEPTNEPDTCSSCQTQPIATQNPATQNLTRQSFLQHQPPNILTNASNRLSVTSMSLYSPQANIGLAIGGARETGLTADGYDILKRSKSLNKRKSQSGLEDKKNRDSTSSSIHLAYDAEVLSPVPTEYVQVRETPIINASERRARVKSSYFAAGTYPRVSTLPSGTYSIATATKVNVGHRHSFGKDKIPLQKSTSKRERDTQALTHALGLISPKSEYMPSPPPTLYPDDSMTENKRPRKRNPSDRKPVETIPLQAAVMESGISGSGTLMKMEFGLSQMSLSVLALEGDENEKGRMRIPEVKEGFGSRHNLPITLPLRTMDKAPRVPSPPPLPSLTQMGLAHNNPESYANYRSPTYSIYGFYENDRMSSFAK